MEVILRPDGESVAATAYELVLSALKAKPNLVLGLATGNTPLALYRRLREARLDLRKVRFFNLDELVGLGPKDSRSFQHFLRANLLDGLKVTPGNVRLLRGDADDLEQAAASYEAAIRKAGGIDLQILGIGRNGHIGFNEPGSSLGSRTRPKTLEAKTLEDYARGFPAAKAVPRFSITMGIGTILEARRLLLLATGGTKAEPIRRVVEGPVTSEVPGSALQFHPLAHVILDEAAGARLSRRDYWKWVYANKWRVG
ncbi:MAG TPA: glucosamine-6-phosphate deaminase, partial [Elusimicrobia bacterium]|nr:glucosamine-6-phosphate deaminase [Elusimicrobiota bacterium]